MQARYNYYAYGEDLSAVVTQGTDYKYTGKELDEESGFNLYYYGARFYDARVGRFVSVDPLAHKYPAWSPYVHTLDNPMKLVDPNGRFVIVPMLLMAAGAYIYSELKTPNVANAPATEEEAIESPSELNEIDEMVSGAMLGQSLLRAGVKETFKGVVRVATGTNKKENRGRHGGPEHKAEVAKRGKELQKEGKKILAGGGMRPEKSVVTPENKRRYPDITAMDKKTGEMHYENVGWTTKSGQPVSREREALKDIERATEKKPIFTPISQPKNRD